MSTKDSRIETFIQDNLQVFLDNTAIYKLETIARDISAKVFEVETGLGVDCSRNSYDHKIYPYLFPNVGLDMFANPKDNLHTLNRYLAKYNLTVESVVRFKRWHHLFGGCYFKHIAGDEYIIHGSYYGDQLLDFICVVATGIIPENRHRSNEFNFENSDTAFSFTVENITVKKYKNGKLIIRGVTPIQLDFIIKVYQHHKSYSEFLRSDPTRAIAD